MAAVSLSDVNKIYPNGFQAVHNLNLEVADGEFLVLVGPSGCGKSTALRMIAGLEDISTGVLRIGDRVANDLEPKERDIAMVFQSYALYPHMSVRENIGFPLRLAKTPKKDASRRVDITARMLELVEQLDKKPGLLSGGQRQRVAMGRAIVRQPSAFLLDEPLSNLDAKLRVQMRAEIASLQRELGVTTVYVTHDQVEAMTMGDRVAVLKDGYLQQVDSPQNLYDRPVNVFVASFIGSPSMNLFEGALSGNSLTLGSRTMELPESVFERHQALRGRDGQTVIVGIRPEDFSDADYVSRDRRFVAIEADVTLTESLGSEVIVHFALDAPRVDAGDPDHVDELTEAAAVGRFDPRTGARAGDSIQIAISVDNLHFFDFEGRTRI
jgi:multiple sugar transport system ATP-binding protein